MEYVLCGIKKLDIAESMAEKFMRPSQLKYRKHLFNIYGIVFEYAHTVHTYNHFAVCLIRITF